MTSDPNSLRNINNITKMYLLNMKLQESLAISISGDLLLVLCPCLFLHLVWQENLPAAWISYAQQIFFKTPFLVFRTISFALQDHLLHFFTISSVPMILMLCLRICMPNTVHRCFPTLFWIMPHLEGL